MTEENFDAIIIGAGQAGPSLTAAFSKAGKKVAIIERKNFGGTCINNGCIPSKTYVAHAKVVNNIRHSEKYGVTVSGFSVDLKKIKERKDSIKLNMRNSLKEWMLSLANCTVIEGHAKFESPHVISVNNRLLKADQIFLDLGARAQILDIPGLDQISYLTNATILDLEKLPEHLVIIGGGYVGVEFAQIFVRFGSQVTILQRNALLMPKEDQETSKEVEAILKKDGVQVLTGVFGISVKPGSAGEKIILIIDHDSQKKELKASHLLLAAGRCPNTDSLGLDKAGVKVNARGIIEVNDQLQSSQPHIWAMGECNGKGAFTHTSYNDYQIVYDNIFGSKHKSVKDRIPIFALFTDPPLGRVGLTEKEAIAQNIPILKASMPMSALPRAQAKGETEGFLSILVHADSKEIIGACFFGTGCDETVQLIAEVMYAKKPYMLIIESVLIHPTISEMIPVLLQKLERVKSLA